MKIDWKAYQTNGFFDELVDTQGNIRTHGKQLAEFFASLSQEELIKARAVADLAIKEMGITFTVYNEGNMIDRAWPLDIIPRTDGVSTKVRSRCILFKPKPFNVAPWSFLRPIELPICFTVIVFFAAII